MSRVSTDDVLARCVRAYDRFCKSSGMIPQQPSASMSTVDEKTGRVVLANQRGTLATYSITKTGRVRRESLARSLVAICPLSTHRERHGRFVLDVSTIGRTTGDVIQEDRTERINVRVSKREITMLNELAEKAGLSSADIVRTLIRREHEATFGKRSP